MGKPLLPQAFWFRLAATCPRVEGIPRSSARGPLLDLPAACALPDLSALEERASWASVRVGWNSLGLGIAILADWGRRGFYSARTGRHLSKKNPVVFIPLLILIALSPLVARLLAMAVSRQREYLADATAAQYTRNPGGLAQALEKIRDASMPFHKATRGTAHLFFINPLRRRVDDSDSKLADLLASHPPIAHRIQLLYQMAGIPQPLIRAPRALDQLPGV